MTDELRKRMARLRELAPRLNLATDQGSKWIVDVEKFLVEELRIGISAETLEFDGWADGHTEDGEKRRVVQTLAFGRVGAGFRIHVITQTGIVDALGVWQETIQRVETLWPSCNRETKLKAFDKLPDLLEAIASKTEQLTEAANVTALKMADLIGEAESSGETPELDPRILTCQSCCEKGQLLNVGSTHWGACTDCEMKWRIGVNLLPSWREETPDDWKRNIAILDRLTADE